MPPLTGVPTPRASCGSTESCRTTNGIAIRIASSIAECRRRSSISLQHPGSNRLPRCASLGTTAHLQHRPGIPIHFRGLPQDPQGPFHSNQYGRPRTGHRQHLHRRLLAVHQVRTDLCFGLRRWHRVASSQQPLHRLLQFRVGTSGDPVRDTCALVSASSRPPTAAMNATALGSAPSPGIYRFAAKQIRPAGNGFPRSQTVWLAFRLALGARPCVALSFRRTFFSLLYNRHHLCHSIHAANPGSPLKESISSVQCLGSTSLFSDRTRIRNRIHLRPSPTRHPQPLRRPFLLQ